MQKNGMDVSVLQRPIVIKQLVYMLAVLISHAALVIAMKSRKFGDLQSELEEESILMKGL